MATHQPTPAHEYAQIFPLAEGEPLWALSEHIKEHGQQDAIVLLDDKVLDGRRRELACFRAEVEPKYRKFGSKKEDGGDPLEFVWAHNFHRRNLGSGDQALCAARYATAKRGNPDLSKNAGKSQISQNAKIGPSRQEAAEKFGVSTAEVDRAKVVVSKGTKELQQAVSEGTVSVSDAAKVASEPTKTQNAAVKAVKEGKARTATQAVREAGDDHEQIEAERSANKRERRENGKPVYEDKIITDLLGKLSRAWNDRSKAFGKTSGAKAMQVAIDGVCEAWKAWRKETA